MIQSILRKSYQRQLVSFIQRNRIASGRLTLATLVNESDSSSNGAFRTAWVFLSASAAVGAMTKRMKCDDIANDDDDDDEGEEDPYDNLPEEDEPTHCSICLTYRQGPCRPYWRKVEACTKDNELKKDEGDEESSAYEENENVDQDDEGSQKDPPCLKYMLPWIDCATGFRNLYNLIELDTNYTMGIADLEKEATENLCWVPSNGPKIDWSTWTRYVQQSGWKPPGIKRRNSDYKGKTLWKTLDQTKDPEIVEIEATVSTTQDSGVLECAYAQDQYGNVIGFTYGTKPSEAHQDDEKDGEQSNNTVTVKIRLLPNVTESVTIAAAYTQPPNDENNENKENESLESHVYKSKPYQLKMMAKMTNKE